MKKQLNDNARSIFGNAIEIASDDERRAYVEQMCAGDAQLRADV